MADLICPKCKKPFDSNNAESLVTRAVAAVAMAAVGAELCGGIGMVVAPGVGIGGALPGAGVGGLIGWFVADQFRRCPIKACGNVFKT